MVDWSVGQLVAQLVVRSFGHENVWWLAVGGLVLGVDCLVSQLVG